MKSKSTSLLAFATLALVGLFALPVVSFSGDRDTSAELVLKAPTLSPAVGLFSLKTETDATVYVASGTTPVFLSIADLRAKESSDALYRLRVERLLRTPVNVSRYRPAHDCADLAVNEPNIRMLLHLRQRHQSGSGHRE